MNANDKVRHALKSLVEAETARAAAAVALTRAEEQKEQATKEAVRVLHVTVPGKAVHFDGWRYTVKESLDHSGQPGALEIENSSDVFLGGPAA